MFVCVCVCAACTCTYPQSAQCVYSMGNQRMICTHFNALVFGGISKQKVGICYARYSQPQHNIHNTHENWHKRLPYLWCVIQDETSRFPKNAEKIAISRLPPNFFSWICFGTAILKQSLEENSEAAFKSHILSIFVSRRVSSWEYYTYMLTLNLHDFHLACDSKSSIGIVGPSCECESHRICRVFGLYSS